MTVLESVAEGLAEVIRIAAGILLFIVATAMITVVLGRYIGFVTAWADEVARIAFVWCACLGAASSVHRGLHFTVVQKSKVSNYALRRVLETITNAVIFGLCALLIWATFQSIPVASLSRLPALGVSKVWFHSAITVFAVLADLFLAMNLVLIWRRV